MNNTLQKGLHHILFISFKPQISIEVREQIRSRYVALSDSCGGVQEGILQWRIEKNLDTRKGVHLIEYAVFSDTEAFEKFKKHPAHVALVEELKTIADWTVGDFMCV